MGDTTPMIGQTPLTTQTLVASLRSCTCPMCGRVKRAAETLCRDDYRRLPRELQKALYRRVGEGYDAAVHAAFDYLGVMVFRGAGGGRRDGAAVSKTPHENAVADVAVEVKSKLYPSVTVDGLLCRPDDAKDLCVQVRRRMGKRLEDSDVLKALLNARKRGRVK